MPIERVPQGEEVPMPTLALLLFQMLLLPEVQTEFRVLPVKESPVPAMTVPWRPKDEVA